MATPFENSACPVTGHFRFPDDFTTPPGNPLGMAPRYRDIQQDGGIAQVILPGGEPAWLVVGHTLVKQALRDPALVRGGADGIDPFLPLAPLIASLDGDEHRRVRNLAQDAFSPGAVSRLRPRVEEVVEQTLNTMLNTGRPADLVDSFGLPMSLNLIGELLGIPAEDRAQFRVWSDNLLGLGPDSKDEAFVRLLPMLEYMKELAARRTAEPTSDLMSVMTRRAVEQGLDTDAVSLMAIGITVGGWETTAAAIACGSYVLLTTDHPDGTTWWRHMHHHPEMLRATIEEVLRTSPSSNLGSNQPRRAAYDTRIGDTTISAGEIVLGVHDAASLDPTVFPEPERFDPSRTRNPHLAFSFGPHLCLGGHLARMELQVAFAALTHRLPDMRLAVDPEDLVWDLSTIVRRPTVLPVTWGPSST